MNCSKYRPSRFAPFVWLIGLRESSAFTLDMPSVLASVPVALGTKAATHHSLGCLAFHPLDSDMDSALLLGAATPFALSFNTTNTASGMDSKMIGSYKPTIPFKSLFGRHLSQLDASLVAHLYTITADFWLVGSLPVLHGFKGTASPSTSTRQPLLIQ